MHSFLAQAPTSQIVVIAIIFAVLVAMMIGHGPQPSWRSRQRNRLFRRAAESRRAAASHLRLQFVAAGPRRADRHRLCQPCDLRRGVHHRHQRAARV